jgi:Tfp pilus assembly protein PilN
MAKNSASINLLRNDNKETFEHIINWAVTIGRILVIVVELAELAAFLYRFTLDNQLQDLHSKIKQEQAIIELQKTNEDTYRNLQDRLSIISSFAKSGTNSLKIFKDILSFTPNGMTFTTVTFSSNTMHLEANLESVSPLSSFIGKLRSYSLINTVSLDKIENRTSSSIINVGISTTFKQQGGANAVSNN